MIRLLARIGGVPEARVRGALAAMIENDGVIALPFMVVILTLGGMAGAAWGYMFP